MGKNKNFCMVKIRQDRECYFCKCTILKGTTCLTINSRYSARKWLCNECLDLKYKCAEAKSSCNNVAFGDDGGFLANMDYLLEVESELETRRS